MSIRVALAGFLALATPAAADDLDFLLDAPAAGDAGKPSVGVPAPRKVAASLHDGHAFGPRLRADGKWVAYGVREAVKGTFKTSYYVRPLEGDALFRSVWPNQHPTFTTGEGTASFTDLVGFEWAPDNVHNAMVCLHKSKGEDVLLETMAVRFSGSGAQNQPAFSPDGTRVVVVSQDDEGVGTDLWVADTRDGAEPLQLTFTRESERHPAWHPKDERILHEQRNPLGGDIWEFDLATFSARPLVRWGTSDEVLPSYSPDGTRVAFLSNKDAPDGLRYDLFVTRPGEPLPKAIAVGVRVSDKGLGYAWDPLGRYLITVLDDAAKGYPLVIVPVDGSAEPRAVSATRDNQDPVLTTIGSTARMAWVALDPDRPPDQPYRVVWVLDFPVADLGALRP